MQTHPPLPSIDTAPDTLLDGHLWIEELIDGLTFRFRMRESGLFEFGDTEREFDTDRVPLAYRHAVRAVRNQFDRDQFRRALDSVESVTFLAVAVGGGGTPYDWARTPSVLGTDVWNGTTERYLPLDSSRQVFKQVGIEPVNTIDREVRGRDFDTRAYSVPTSDWYDGPAFGVVLRDKTGNRAAIRPDKSLPVTDQPTEVDEIATQLSERWLNQVIQDVSREDGEDTVERVVTRSVERLAREGRLPEHTGSAAESEFRAVVNDRVNRHLRE